MQTLDIISVNLWQILISLANLVILFLILKRFLYKPVKRVMEERQSAIDERYSAAEEAQRSANEAKESWNAKLEGAQNEADEIIQNATESAEKRGEKIVSEAKERADGIIRRAEEEARLERSKATEGIKREIVEVSAILTEKMLEREINTEDHRALIDSFIAEIGDEND